MNSRSAWMIVTHRVLLCKDWVFHPHLFLHVHPLQLPEKKTQTNNINIIEYHPFKISSFPIPNIQNYKGAYNFCFRNMAYPSIPPSPSISPNEWHAMSELTTPVVHPELLHYLGWTRKKDAGQLPCKTRGFFETMNRRFVGLFTFVYL